MQTLNQILDAALKFGGPEFYKSRVPSCIYTNLRDGYGRRPYQQEAFGRFVFYLNEYHERPKGVPIQLLYHMATGSGKTLIMAGLIIYLYEKGYRNFLFFVNSANIIDKTRDNFFNTASTKYLFSDNISIGDKQIRIKEVDNFQAANKEDINIVFSTIQGLHSRLNTPKENSLTYDDFENKSIVLISDEAHHINAETKIGSDLGAEEREEIISWEGTVNRIFNANSGNILLEFTATADLSMPEIEAKYNDKLIYDYPLKQFRKDGYSKEVKVLQADLPPFDRALQGVLLSQYRRKVFEKYKKLIKPVILFKSKTIKESQSFFKEFAIGIKNLKISDLQKIKKSKPDAVIKRVFQYFEANNISFDNLITELKEDFAAEKLISVNSKDESEQKQLAVNSLEDESNEYRAVFAVDKLNEGWDVLNLFDIVRLYDTRDAKQGKPGKTTMSEAQLIGRGARYCPFQISSDQSAYTRKYDFDIDNELRICEELYYHSAYNPRYIDELNTALEEIGIKAKEINEIDLELKDSFKQTTFYKTGYIFINKQIKYDRSGIFSLPSSLVDTTHKVSLKTGFTKSSIVFDKQEVASSFKTQLIKPLQFLGIPVIRKAINKLDFYQFSNLRSYFNNLSSISEFVNSTDYLGKIVIEIEGTEENLNNLSQTDKLNIATDVLRNIADVISSSNTEFQGTKEFKPYLLKDKIKNKKVHISIDEYSDKESGIPQSSSKNSNLRLDLSKKDWYVFTDNYGTSEEKYLVKFINQTYDKLKSKYSEIYLVRNERHFKIYNFEDGKPFEPDFVLFLRNPKSKIFVQYQVFIEPKGAHLIASDKWKENFLMSLKNEHKLEELWKNSKYIIWGMPFFNESGKVNFEKDFNKLFDA